LILRDWLIHANARLNALGVESPRLEAQLLAAHVLGVDRTWVLTHPEAEFNDLAGENLLQRREGWEPLAYIVGGREFYGRWFRVSRAVLVPRQDTETLVDAALAWGKRNVLDIGTGSGCLAITLKLERPGWNVTAVDISGAALEVAQENAERLEAEVRLVLSDAFAALSGEEFDLVVSNPPYIGQDEALPPEVRNYEPGMALFSGPTGLEFYERLALEAKPHLTQDGILAIEVGHTQAAAVRDLFTAAGWEHVETRKDLCGIERVVVVRRSADRCASNA